MREFTIALRSGRRLVIRADHCVARPDGLIELVADPPPREPEIGRFDDRTDVVAVFDRQEVEWLADNGRLVREEPRPPVADEPLTF